MKLKLAAAVVFAAATSGALAVSARSSDPQDLTVHEWGTFTSIAGEEGQAIEWIPQSGPYDLPCFVEQVGFRYKASLFGTVRMETPVLYFYSPRETTVDVRVTFPQGLLTEWYPKARISPARGVLSWDSVRVTPGLTPALPVEAGSSHYYLARGTDAAPIAVGSQREKFLFYRGVGRFRPPLSAVSLKDGGIEIRSLDDGPVGDVIVFDNHRGQRAHRLAHVQGSARTLLPMAEGEGSVEDDLRALLLKHGLFAKEADAMVATWQDSWFDQGTRVFYVMSGASVDRLLPLDINPKPASVARVFVGRIEMVTPAVVGEVKAALEASDFATIRKHERFLQVILDRMSRGNATERARLDGRLRTFYASRPVAAGC